MGIVTKLKLNLCLLAFANLLLKLADLFLKRKALALSAFFLSAEGFDRI